MTQGADDESSGGERRCSTEELTDSSPPERLPGPPLSPRHWTSSRSRPLTTPLHSTAVRVTRVAQRRGVTSGPRRTVRYMATPQPQDPDGLIGEAARSRAGRYFEAREVNQKIGVATAGDLWRWIQRGAAQPLNGAPLPLLAGDRVFYRGQCDADFGLTSALYRQCRDGRGRVTEEDLRHVEQRVLTAMRREGLGRRMSDGELLTVLQHHGIATRLIDVSEEAFEALYFAVNGSDAVDGRLFIIRLHDLPGGGFDQMSFDRDQGQDLPWRGVIVAKYRAAATWTQRVGVVDAQHLDPRMRAQRGRFLVGGLNKCYPGTDMRIGNDEVPVDERADITTLNINFPLYQRKVQGKAWRATGWTVRVHREWKAELRRRLKGVNEPITADYMYPPLGEVSRLARRVALDALKEGAP